MTNRRDLTFTNLDQVMPDVDRLLRGHKTVGQWSLGQMCNHLAGGMRVGLDGYEGAKPPWILRKTLAPLILKRLLKEGKMKEGFKTPFEPKPGLDARTEAEALRKTISEFVNHSGPYRDHPFFGPMTPEQWTRLHCIHCAHHLSFALPAE